MAKKFCINMQIHAEGENLDILKLARKTANINVKNYSFTTVGKAHM